MKKKKQQTEKQVKRPTKHLESVLVKLGVPVWQGQSYAVELIRNKKQEEQGKAVSDL